MRTVSVDELHDPPGLQRHCTPFRPTPLDRPDAIFAPFLPVSVYESHQTVDPQYYASEMEFLPCTPLTIGHSRVQSVKIVEPPPRAQRRSSEHSEGEQATIASHVDHALPEVAPNRSINESRHHSDGIMILAPFLWSTIEPLHPDKKGTSHHVRSVGRDFGSTSYLCSKTTTI